MISRLLVVLCALLFATQAFSEAPKSLYGPTDYAFISSKGFPNLAVVDLRSGQQIDTVKLPVTAKILAASTDRPYLAFSDRFTHGVYVMNLQTREIELFDLPAKAYRLVFIPNTSKLVIVLEKQVATLDYERGELNVIEREFQHLYTRFNTIFSVYSQTIWVTQERTPIIYRYRFDKPEEGWEAIDIGDTRGFGRGAPSFEDQIIAFNTYYADEGIIYFNDSGKTITTGPMYDSRPLNEPMVEPYIDNGTRHVIFGDKRGNLKIYDLRKSDEPEDFKVSFPHVSLKAVGSINI
ncbi:hypothetical protein L0B52_09470 [Suttonella sp. R2A3]|uniref:hypothetical protein n=1 Tax=Suttonella sp. R2A3 TaxID=2908648 RepID=UPI001F1AC737|nr:hypothetical protein [Suttonella sp. R2A3]UJF24539.1 hypothetical protein L0B52_09470 [Suttonella sp. R2A3]